MRPESLMVSAALMMAACSTTEKYNNSALASPEELAIQDPEPDEVGDQPVFCNPTNKTGEELRKCYEYNESLYKVFDDEAKKREPWFNFTPDSWVQSPEIERRFVVPVLNESEAIKRLETTPSIELSPAEAQQLTGKAPVEGGRKPYLVRALLYYRETGAFSVFTKAGSILVSHESIGSSIPPETRSALVVYLDFKPKEIFVDCGVVE